MVSDIISVLNDLDVCISSGEFVHHVHTLYIQLKHFATSPGIRPYLQKIALKLKQKKMIEQRGDQYIIKTCSTFRNYTISFIVGQEFEEFTEGLDNRHVKVKMKEWQRIACSM